MKLTIPKYSDAEARAILIYQEGQDETQDNVEDLAVPSSKKKDGQSTELDSNHPLSVVYFL